MTTLGIEILYIQYEKILYVSVEVINLWYRIGHPAEGRITSQTYLLSASTGLRHPTGYYRMLPS